VGRPSAHREQRKAEIRKLMQRPRTLQRLQQADDLFAQYADRATTSMSQS